MTELKSKETGTDQMYSAVTTLSKMIMGNECLNFKDLKTARRLPLSLSRKRRISLLFKKKPQHGTKQPTFCIFAKTTLRVVKTEIKMRHRSENKIDLITVLSSPGWE